MKRCPAGHLYDPEEHDSCPWCAVTTNDGGVPTHVLRENESSLSSTRTLPHNQQSAPTIPLEPEKEQNTQNFDSADVGNQTVHFRKSKKDVDPVVGWLVCVEGPERGRDYRIRSGKNSFGRSESMDIRVGGDEAISRKDHAFIVYDPKRYCFRIQSGLSRGLVYLNDEEVISSENLKVYDKIEIGQSQFLFIPLCGDSFHWSV